MLIMEAATKSVHAFVSETLSTVVPAQAQAELLSLAVAALRLATTPSGSPGSNDSCRCRPPDNPLDSSDSESETKSDPKETVITLDEVSWHDNASDCWVIIYDRVYDVTDFLYEHPGGSDVLLEHAGHDASSAFRSSGHSKAALRALDRFLVGELPMHERLYRKPGGYKLSDLPE